MRLVELDAALHVHVIWSKLPGRTLETLGGELGLGHCVNETSPFDKSRDLAWVGRVHTKEGIESFVSILVANDDLRCSTVLRLSIFTLLVSARNWISFATRLDLLLAGYDALLKLPVISFEAS